MLLDPNSRPMGCEGRADAPRSSAIPIASTGCCGSCSPRRPGRRAGRGARARRVRAPASLPALRHRPARALRRPSARTRSVPPRLPAPAVGRRRRRRPPGARAGRLRAARNRQSRVPAGAARRAAGGRRRARCSTASARLFHTAPTRTRSSCKSLLGLIDERHAAFNDTLYQLEPDVKDAPGALRDLSATRTIAMLTDPLLLRRGPAEPARFDDAEDFLLRVRSTLHLECRRNQNVLGHELQERDGRPARLSGRRAAPARRAADERLLPPRADRQPLARWARRTRRCRSVRTWGCRATAIRFLDPVQAARNPASWIGAFQAAVDGGHRRLRGGAVVHPAARRSLSRRRLLSRRRASARRCVSLLRPRPGLYAGCRRCTTAACSGRVFPEFQAISWRVVRDFYHKYTVDEHTLLTIRNLERLSRTPTQPIGSASATCSPSCRAAGAARAGAALARRRQVARRRPRARERADGAGRCSTGCSVAGEARDDGPVPHPAPPPDVARRVPARHRGPRHRQGLRRRSSAPRAA